MKPARLVVLGIAVIAGGIAAYMASGSRQPEAPKPQVVQVPQLETAEVLVAKTDLSRGQLIESHDVGWQVWPKESANGSFVKKSERPDAIQQFTGAIVRVPVVLGQPIFDPMVVFAKGSGFMAAILPKGMRAVSMEIAPENDAGGFILPEDHVDIVLTRKDRSPVTGVEKVVSETILRNVRVLAVDQAVEEKNGTRVVVGRTATVELTPKQAETLAMSRQLGTLSLALRSLLDSQSSVPEGGEQRDDTRTSINTVRFGVSTMTLAH